MTTHTLLNRMAVLGPRRRGSRLWMTVGGAVLVAAIAGCLYAGLALLRSPAPRTHRLRMTTDISRRNVALAERIRADGAGHRLEILPTAKEYGTLDALEEVDSTSDIKLGLIVGGVTKGNYPHVRTVTNLTQEHLHLLMKPELAGRGIAALHGKRIFLGPPTTASHHVARDVLAFAGLHSTTEDKKGGYIADPASREETLRELIRIESLVEQARADAIARLPDAFMFLGPLPSPFAQRLVSDYGYRLVPLLFAEAYGLDHLNPPTADGVRIDRSMLTPGVIPAYTYGSNPPEPAKEYSTICAPLILIAQDDTDPEAVYLLLETIYDTPLANKIRAEALDKQTNTFRRHAGTERFLHRKDPLLTPEGVLILGRLVGGIGCFLSGVIALYGLLRLRSLRRFEQYYRDIGQIEMIALGLEDDPSAPLDAGSLRSYLEGRLNTLKCKALADFAEGGLKGEGLMAGIIALINDTRGSLAGVVAVRNGVRQSSAPDKLDAAARLSSGICPKSEAQECAQS